MTEDDVLRELNILQDEHENAEKRLKLLVDWDFNDIECDLNDVELDFERVKKKKLPKIEHINYKLLNNKSKLF